MTTLFDPLRLGRLTCPNRIVMAPLTRSRADTEGHAQPIMGVYYAQRASSGLILSEATCISPIGRGWINVPGIWSDAQVAAWKPVTQAVHDAGGRIYCQLWHMGRVVHPDFIGGATPVSASAIAAPGANMTPLSGGEKRAYVTPHALSIEEIAATVADYAAAAKNALAAGFDGVQIHAANGYLIDQFLRDSTNHRTDAYGGSIENRMRFLREVVTAVVDAVGADQVAVRLSPNGEIQGCVDSQPQALFTAVADMLNQFGLAFLEMREARESGGFVSSDQPRLSPFIRAAFKGPLILNGDYSYEEANDAIAKGACDAVSFGRIYITNPDLPERFKAGAPLAPLPDPRSHYFGGDKGYADFPTMEKAQS